MLKGSIFMKSQITIHHFNHFVFKSRRRISNMVSIRWQNVHRGQHLPAHPRLGHDAPGSSVCHCTSQHVWLEEHLCSCYVRKQRRIYRSFNREFMWRFIPVGCFLFTEFRNFPDCWRRPQTGFFTSITWIPRMEASVSSFRNTGMF